VFQEPINGKSAKCIVSNIRIYVKHKFQAFTNNDVTLAAEKKPLLLEKHIEYIANHGNDKNDFVSK
jgi:hypothetical protein